MKAFIGIPLVLVFLLMGCGEKSSSPDTSGEGVEHPSFSKDIRPILDTHCMKCHGSSTPPAGYSHASYEGVMGNGSDDKPNVIPGKPSESLLYQRVESGTMPPGGRLASKDIATIRRWIEQGAQNN